MGAGESYASKILFAKVLASNEYFWIFLTAICSMLKFNLVSCFLLVLVFIVGVGFGVFLK